MSKLKTPDSFEQAIEQLEAIVLKIENDEIKLDAALEQYQTGMQLVKFCQNKLVEVEQKVKLLDNETGELKDLNIE
jgi:exodeoxyribonuclease VII small subunit